MTIVPYPFMQINRLCVFKSGSPVYDEKFHNGLNIIRGENGSGKSTITDLIFYVLGGEGINWKPEPKSCDYVVAELNISGALITLKRDITDVPSAIMVFNDGYDVSSKTGFIGWNAYPVNRARAAQNELNFSQIMFKALGIPEAAAGDVSNLTMHQILRLLYCDQMQSPVQRIFRFERFDQPDTRGIIGELLTGIGGVDLYEKILQKRDLDKEFQKYEAELKNLLNVVRLKSISLSVDGLNSKIAENNQAIAALSQQLEEQSFDTSALKKLQKEHEKRIRELQEKLGSIREAMSQTSDKIQNIKFELADDYAFMDYLRGNLKHISETQMSYDVLGMIKFEYCPSCFSPIHGEQESDHESCYLCKENIDHLNISNKILNIKIDFSSQLRETEFLVKEREQEVKKLEEQKASFVEENRRWSQEYDVQISGAINSQDSKVSAISERIGYLKSENKNLESYLGIAQEIDKLSTEKGRVQGEISKLNDEIKGLELSRERRSQRVHSAVSKICVEILKKDLDRQEQFANASNVDYSFRDDVIMVDGTSNFSASGIVVLKNTFHLGLYLASVADDQFRLPRFMIMDTTEDKGMEKERSQRLQENIAEYVSNLRTPNQFILTTSMVSPKLDKPEYVVGRKYSRESKTLQFSRGDVNQGH